MRITRIDIEGRDGHYATIARRKGSQWIEVTILTPSNPDGKEHRIAANADESDLRNLATNLHHALDGNTETKDDIDKYYRVLQCYAA